jgi:hypothetical protein
MKLDLSKSSLEQNHGILLGEALENNFYLEELVLDFNNLIDVGAKGIGRGIHANKTNSRLRVLSLISNNITDDGAASLIKNTSKNVTHLMLSMNKVNCERSSGGGGGGGEALLLDLLEHFREHKKTHHSVLSFKEIDLSHNVIDNESFVQELKKYAEMLEFNFLLHGNLGTRTGLRFPTGTVKKFKAKRVLKNPGGKGSGGGGGEPVYVMEYVEDTADEEQKIKNERAYYNILNKTIKNAAILQEMSSVSYQRDPYDSKRLYMRRRGYGDCCLLLKYALLCTDYSVHICLFFSLFCFTKYIINIFTHSFFMYRSSICECLLILSYFSKY